MFFNRKKTHEDEPAGLSDKRNAEEAGAKVKRQPRVFSRDLVAGLEPVTTVQEMRQWDALAVELGLSGFALMESAAQGALRVLLSHVSNVRGKICHLLMGAGNNGGDAACLSRQLLDHGACPVVFHTKDLDTYSGDAAQHLALARACGVEFRPAEEFDGHCDILVDGLLGTGFSGELREDALELVQRANKGSQSFTLALDIPSGLDATSGRPCPKAIVANATATFAAAKPGLVLPWARAYTGELHTVYIGTPQKVQEKAGASFRLLQKKDLACLPNPLPCGYKNAYGHVVVVGGAHGMSGAAHVAARAALRSGSGLVTCACPAFDVKDVRLAMPEIMTRALGEPEEMQWKKRHAGEMADLLARCTSLVVGPGMGRGRDSADFLQALLCERPSSPMVLDADALMLLAANPKLFAHLERDDVITPHPGEAAALLGRNTGDIAQDPFGAVDALVALAGCTVVLKGAATLVRAPGFPLLIYPNDICQLSVGGSGDCLAGVVASLMGQGAEGLAAAALGVVWHGEAGRYLAAKYPNRGNLASEIADALSCARG